MGIEKAKTGCYLYHLTEINNLESILENGLLPRKELIESGIKFEDIADVDIINKRKELSLDNYTPFHFHPYSSFDVAVKGSHQDKDFMYICINRGLARDNKFKILPMHPLSLNDYKLYEYDEGFDKIDWDTLMKKGTTDEYSKHVKMAECLTDLLIPVEYFSAIYVKNEKLKNYVEEKMQEKKYTFKLPYVNVQECWF